MKNRRKRLVKGGLLFGVILSSLSASLAFSSTQLVNRNLLSASQVDIEAITQQAGTLAESGKKLEAIIMALKAVKQLEKSQTTDIKTQNMVKGALLSALSSDRPALSRFEQHSDSIWSARFSPDGQNIITASIDGTANLWHADGTLLRTIENQADWVTDAVFSPDGRTIATTTTDKEITTKLWRTDGTLLHTLEGSRAQFSPDSRTLITSRYGTVLIWRTDGTLLNTLQGESSRSVCFSPDGKTIVTADAEGVAKLWKADGTALLQTLEGHRDAITKVRFSPDGSLIATASNDGTARLWKTDGSLLQVLEVDSDDVNDVRFSPDSSLIATASENVQFGRAGNTPHKQTVKLWKTDGTLLKTIEGKQVRFSPSGDMIATAHYNTLYLHKTDGTLFDTIGGKPDDYKTDISNITDINFSPDGRTILGAGAQGKAKLWRADDSALPHVRSYLHTLDHSGYVEDVSFSPDSRMIATTSHNDNAINLWQENGNLLRRLEVGENPMFTNFSPDGEMVSTWLGAISLRLLKVDGTPLPIEGHGIAFSPDSRTIVTRSRDGIQLWRPDGTLLHTLVENSEEIMSAEFSPDGRLLATVSQAGGVQLWQPDGTLLQTMAGKNVSISPDSHSIAIVDDNNIQIWHTDGTLIGTIKNYGKGRQRMRFNSDSQTVTLINREEGIQIWRTDGTLLRTLQGSLDGSDAGLAIATFSADDRTIAIKIFDDTTKLWRMDGTFIGTLEGHDDGFSPDSHVIATSVSDDSTHLWHTDGTQLTTLEGNDVVFSPDSRMIATVVKDASLHQTIVKLWPWSVEGVTRHTCKQMKAYLQSSPHVEIDDRTLCDGV